MNAEIEQHELKPCPFCGGEAELAWTPDEGDDRFYTVLCPACNASIGMLSAEVVAIKCWNRRVGRRRTMTEPKPCLHCGGELFVKKTYGGYFWGCPGCGVESSCLYATEEDAIAAGSRRVDDERAVGKMREVLMAAQVFYIDEINAAMGNAKPGRCRVCDEPVPNEKLPWCEHCAKEMVARELNAVREVSSSNE